MYTYTVKLELKPSLQQEMVEYLYNKHQPDLVKTGCFLDYTLEVDTTTGEVIARYKCESQEMFEQYIEKHADNLRNEVMQLFPDGIISANRNFCKMIKY